MRATLVSFAICAMLASAAQAGAQEIPAPEAGAQAYRMACASCHLAEEARNLAGPHLVGLVGRKAGSVEGARYSTALAESGIFWNAETLDAYLADPRTAVPGTSKPVAVRNPKQRAAIIGYLVSLSAPSAL